MSPTRGHRAGPGRTCSVTLGPALTFPAPAFLPQTTGSAPVEIRYTVGVTCVQVPPPPQVAFCSCPALKRAGSAMQGGLGVLSGVETLFPAPGGPLSRGPVTRGAPREPDVQVAPRGWRRPGAIVCGRADRSGAPLGQISLPKSPLHGQLEGLPGWVARDGCLHRNWGGEVGAACTRVCSCPPEGYPLGSGSPEAAAGGPARPPELTAPPTPGLVQPWGSGMSL